jgi:hypothetical protein
MPDTEKNQIQELRRELEALRQEFYLNNFISSKDENKYVRFNTRLRVPIYSSAPTTAEIGEIYANSTNGKLYVCTSANTFTLVGSQT